MTPQEEAALVIGGDLRYGSWADDPANVLAIIVGRAADARMRQPWTIETMNSNRLTAEHLTHLSCALVAAAASPYILRGAVLDELIELFGSGL